MNDTATKIHDRLPEGFSYADQVQAATYERGGFVHGASKLCLVRVPGTAGPDKGCDLELAVRLGPPKYSDTITRRPLMRLSLRVAKVAAGDILNWYKAQYNAGFAAGKRSHSVAFDRGDTSHAWDDGYLDAAAGRPKWHLTHCVDHDSCGEA